MISTMGPPEIGTLIAGVGNEVVFVITCVVGVMGCYLGGSIFFKKMASERNVHPAMAPAVQSTRRDMGVTNEEPPPDSSCPVCLAALEHPVGTNCGHTFCALCILEYWRHDQWPHPARCPICRRTITLLLGTLPEDLDELRTQILDYNQRMSGEWRPLLHYLYDVPTILLHLWQDLFSDRGPLLIRRLYLGYIVILLLLYLLSPFDIVPESVFGIIGLVDDIMILLFVVVYISLLYRATLTERT